MKTLRNAINSKPAMNLDQSLKQNQEHDLSAFEFETQTNRFVILPSGLYKAKLESVNLIQGKFSKVFKASFEILESPYEGVLINDLFNRPKNQTIYRTSKLEKLIKAILGKSTCKLNREKINLVKDLVGKECRLDIEQRGHIIKIIAYKLLD